MSRDMRSLMNSSTLHRLESNLHPFLQHVKLRVAHRKCDLLATDHASLEDLKHCFDYRAVCLRVCAWLRWEWVGGLDIALSLPGSADPYQLCPSLLFSTPGYSILIFCSLCFSSCCFSLMVVLMVGPLWFGSLQSQKNQCFQNILYPSGLLFTSPVMQIHTLRGQSTISSVPSSTSMTYYRQQLVSIN